MNGLKYLRKLLLGLFGWVGLFVLVTWAKSLRVVFHGLEHATNLCDKTPIIFTFWHQQLLVLPFVFPWPRRMDTLISPSGDGDFIAAIVERHRYHAIRGSARKGAQAAHQMMLERLTQGVDQSIAADGPLGPPWLAKMGLIKLAQQANKPLVPVVYGSRWGIHLKTWDRLWLPLPFSKLHIWVGQPFYVAQGDNVMAAYQAFNLQMHQLTQLAFASAKRALPRLPNLDNTVTANQASS